MAIAGRLGFIGGGKMGEALIKGLLRAKVISAQQIGLFDSDSKRRECLKDTYGLNIYQSNKELISNSDVVILAVKPQVMASVLSEIQPQMRPEITVISIAAGIPLEFLEGRLPERTRVVRVMPNTPALIGEGVAAVVRGKYATSSDQEITQAIFLAVGKTVVVEEKDMDAVTGLSGSGPAYIFAIMEGLIDGGVRMGLSREVARALVLQTVAGSAKMAIETGEHISGLKEMVTSPGGTTIAGLHVMARAGVHGILMDVVQAATERSLELKKLV